MSSAREQFAKVARAYATSTAHARGEDLVLLASLVPPSVPLVDVGTGAGHVLAAVGARASLALGLDATPEMLAVARDVLRERGVTARLVLADAAALPLAEEAAGAVTSRLAAHHFPRVDAAFGEIARVLRPGASFYFIDNYAPEDEALDRWIDELERTRDPSHVRSHTLAGWQRLLRGAGLEPRVEATLHTELRTDDWLARSQTPPGRADHARAMLRGASAAARETFRIHDDGFSLLKAFVIATRR